MPQSCRIFCYSALMKRLLTITALIFGLNTIAVAQEETDIFIPPPASNIDFTKLTNCPAITVAKCKMLPEDIQTHRLYSRSYRSYYDSGSIRRQGMVAGAIWGGLLGNEIAGDGEGLIGIALGSILGGALGSQARRPKYDLYKRLDEERMSGSRVSYDPSRPLPANPHYLGKHRKGK